MLRKYLLFLSLSFLILSLYACGGSTFHLRGKITDDLKDKVADADIKATMLQAMNDGKIIRPIPTKTDSDGIYKIEGLEPGQYKIKVEKPGYDAVEKGPDFFAKTKNDFDIKLRKQFKLTGTVYSPDGQTVLGAEVNISRKSGDTEELIDSATTDENGKFTVEKLYMDESYIIEAFTDRRRCEREIQHLKSDQQIELVLPEETVRKRNKERKGHVPGKYDYSKQ